MILTALNGHTRTSAAKGINCKGLFLLLFSNITASNVDNLIKDSIVVFILMKIKTIKNSIIFICNISHPHFSNILYV